MFPMNVSVLTSPISQKVTDEQLSEVEMIVNQLVRDNTPASIFENLPIEEAKGMGAMALSEKNMVIM